MLKKLEWKKDVSEYMMEGDSGGFGGYGEVSVITDRPSTWGVLEVDGTRRIRVGYANVGIEPRGYATNK